MALLSVIITVPWSAPLMEVSVALDQKLSVPSMHQGHVEGVQLSVASVPREEWILHARTIDPCVCVCGFWTQIVYTLAQGFVGDVNDGGESLRHL